MTNKRNSRSREGAFKTAVWQEGFPFEQRIFKLLEERGWFVLPNRYFFDSFSGRTKEYDILAGKTWVGKGFTFFLVLVIECKFNPHRIAFYSRLLDDKKYSVQYYIGDYISSYLNEDPISKIFRELKKHHQIFFPKEQIFGYQAFKEVVSLKKGQSKPQNTSLISFNAEHAFTEKAVFGGINNVIQATTYERSIRNQQANLATLIIYFPTVVFSSELYKASLEGEKRSLVKRHLFRYKAGMASSGKNSPEDFSVHLCDVDGFKQLLKAYSYIFNKLVKSLQAVKLK